MTDQKGRLPNLFLVGSMKSATTSLHNYLDMHPDIFMSKSPWKEPHFFVEENNWQKGWDWYYGLFKDAVNEKYLGESSTDYTKLPNYSGVPERIHTYCPDAKILYIMRDPIERAISQYWWEVEFSAEGRKMQQAIVNNDWILNASNYSLQIKPYIKLFGAENVFTLTTEELNTAPDETMKKIFAWLKVDTEIKLAEKEYKTYNRSKEEVNRVIGSGLFSHLKGTKFWELLKKLIPARSPLRYRLKNLLSRPVEKNEEGREETIALLRPIMQPQVKELSELLGKDFPQWKTLHETKSS
jgi:Sulfotransferase domain